MSDWRIALIAEGPTDGVIIGAALKAILDRPFVLTQLQPEPTFPQTLGNGWGGVLNWCRQFQRAGHATLADDPRLGRFDLVILHLDADVADKSYGDYGPGVAAMARSEQWHSLPCARDCPPASAAVSEIHGLLRSWLHPTRVGPKAVLCLPSKASEAWLAAAVLADRRPRMTDLECEPNMEGILANLPKGMRIRKTRREYLVLENRLSDAWGTVKGYCTQAAAFERDTLAALANSRPSPGLTPNV